MILARGDRKQAEEGSKSQRQPYFEKQSWSLCRRADNSAIREKIVAPGDLAESVIQKYEYGTSGGADCGRDSGVS